MDSKQDYLACPVCKTGLSCWEASFVCEFCHRRFDIHKRIPILSSLVDKTRLAAVTDVLAPHVATAIENSSEKDIKIWPELLLQIISEISSSKSGNRVVLNLVDETKAVAKFLLNISSKDHVLNLGPGWDNTTINLARSAGKVTTLDLNLDGLLVLMLKKRYYGLNNIDLIFGGAEKYLPIKDHTFDAIFIQDSLIWSLLPHVCVDEKGVANCNIRGVGNDSGLGFGKSGHTFQLHAFLMEIKRMLKPEGEIFFGIKYYADSKLIRTELEKNTAYLSNVFIRDELTDDWLRHQVKLYGRHRKVETGMESSGFKKGKAYRIGPTSYAPQSLGEFPISMGADRWFQSLRTIKKARQKENHPDETSYIGYSAHKKGLTQSWIDGMLLDLAKSCDVSSDPYSVDRLHVSRKGKLVAIIKHLTAGKNPLVIKVPFHDVSRHMLENNYHTLRGLEKIKHQQTEPNSFLDAIPRSVHKGVYNGQVYFVENKISGVEWKKNRSIFLDKTILRRTLQLLKTMNRISGGGETIQRNTLPNYEERFGCIESILGPHETKERQNWEVIKGRLTEMMNYSNGPRYFRKGDFSMHNVIVAPGKIPSFIDFDESGETFFKTADLSDLLFSFARIRKKISRESFLRIVIKGDLNKLNLGLVPKEILSLLNADLDEFKISSLVSWVDHVYFAIQFEPIKYRKYILNRSFSKTLLSLSSVVGMI